MSLNLNPIFPASYCRWPRVLNYQGQPLVPLPRRVLLIENERDFARDLTLALEDRDSCSVMVAEDSFEAGNMMAQNAFNLVITDWDLPAIDGFAGLRQSERGLNMDPKAPSEWIGGDRVPVVVLTASDRWSAAREKKLRGHFHFLGAVSKNQEIDQILDQIEILFGNLPTQPNVRRVI